MNSGENRKIHGYKCQKCRYVAKLDEFPKGLICPECGGTKLHPACCAKNRQRKLCGKTPMPNGRCHFHGGATPAPGPSHPNYKHGRLSKYLPPGVVTRLAEVKADPDFLSIRENAELVAVRKTQLAERLSTTESGLTWKLLNKAWGQFQLGNRLNQEAGDNAELRAEAREIISTALEDVNKLIKSGASEENRWGEFLDINTAEAGLKASETARLQRLHQMMTAEEVLLLIQQVHNAVLSVVKDNAQRQEIGRLLLAVMNTGIAPAASPRLEAAMAGEAGEIIDVPATESATEQPLPPAPQ